MKQIEAIVRPERLEDVKNALARIGHGGVEVTSVKGHGSQGGVHQMWRRKEYTVDLLPKVRIVTVVPDQDVAFAIAIIIMAARTGRIGDGKIFVSAVDDAVRIRTGETGIDAILGGSEAHQLRTQVRLIDAEAS